MTLEEKAKQKAKEAYPGEDYVCDALQGTFEKGYLAGAAPREKQILKLENENHLLDERCTQLLKDKGELEEQNSHLYNDLTCTSAELTEKSTMLKQAKEIIKKFIQWNYGCCDIPDYKEIVKQAEQFLKEIEK